MRRANARLSRPSESPVVGPQGRPVRPVPDGHRSRRARPRPSPQRRELLPAAAQDQARFPDRPHRHPELLLHRLDRAADDARAFSGDPHPAARGAGTTEDHLRSLKPIRSIQLDAMAEGQTVVRMPVPCSCQFPLRSRTGAKEPSRHGRQPCARMGPARQDETLDLMQAESGNEWCRRRRVRCNDHCLMLTSLTSLT